MGSGGGGCAGGEERMWAVGVGRGRYKRACGGGGEGGEGGEGGGGGGGGEGAEGGWRGWHDHCGSNKTLFSLLFFVSSEYGSMWAVGAVGVLEERNACGRWVWGGKRACGGGGEGGGGGVRAVRAVRAVGAVRALRAVGAGGTGGHAGAAIKHYFLFSFL